MATSPVDGKTILQLVLHQGAVVLADTFLEIHIEGASESVKIPLSALPIKGDDGDTGASALEVVQSVHPEITTPEQFIEFITGPQGKSPYDIAVEGGFVGTPADWLESLIGAAGKSAYEIAVAGGFVGSEAEWVVSLKGDKGDDGKSSYELAVEDGFGGTLPEYLASLHGTDGDDGEDGTNGKSAYELAVDNGFVGDEITYLASLKGTDGQNGDSAFQVAVKNGFVGTEPEWLASLKGADGQPIVIGEYQGILEDAANLPEPEGYEANAYWWIGKHIYMKQGPDWVDLGDFSGPPGRDGTGFQILGELPSTAFLPETGERVGDAWLIAKSMWVWNNTRWQEQGNEGLKGDDGDKGDKGDPGKSALQVLSETYPEIVTAEDMALFLKGETGDRGPVSISWVTDGVKATVEELPDAAAGQQNGHGWLVGTAAPYDFHLFVNDAYVNLGSNAGPKGEDGDKGDDGDQGPRGYSYKVKGVLASVEDLPTVGNLPSDAYRIDKHDWVWDGVQWVDGGDLSGPKGDDGAKGDTGSAINPKGQLASVDLLPETGNLNGDGYEINGQIYAWNETDGEFKLMGQWRGTNGAVGKSAYQSALDAGFVGSEAAWIGSLQGDKGDDGENGKDVEFVGNFANQAALPATSTAYQVATAGGRIYRSTGNNWVDIGPIGTPGQDGEDGINGKSAFELAQDGGFVGTEPEWIASLKGADGKSAYDLAVDAGFVGDEAAYQLSLKGEDGKSAYQLAVDGGFVGDEVAYQESLKGNTGEAGNDVNFRGDFANEAALPLPAASNDYATAEGRVYRYSDADGWVDTGAVGVNGTDGTNGKTNYELAQDDGFQGTLTEYLASLKGTDGEDGDAGKSAYQLAVDGGFPGTEAEWLLSLNGADGEDTKFVGDFADQASLPATTAASEIATAAGRVYRSNGAAWVDVGAVGIQGEVGDTGKSAFELAQDDGYVGTLQEWLASLKGDTGASLYEQAVADGSFTGTLDDFIESQRGPAGLTAYEEALREGFVGTFEEWVESLRGPTGNDGPEGVRGPSGPIIPIVGTKATAAELPTPGNSAEAWAVPDEDSPGTFDCYIWLESTTEWFNLGHIVGAEGPQGVRGERGLQGIQGQRGEKGDKGTIWIVLDRDPDPLDGRVDDYFYNRLTQAFFRKTNTVTWAPLGFIGGGNLNAPTADGLFWAMKDGAWVHNAVLEIPAAAGTYVLKDGVWTSLDAPDGKVIDAATTVDFSAATTFRIENNGNKTITITGLPAAGRTVTRVLKIRGKVGSFSWTPPSGVTLRWFGGTPPATFENDITTIVMHYDGLEIVASIPD